MDNSLPALLVLKLFSGIHGQASRTTTETVTLGSEFSCVADFAEQLSIVLSAIRGVQHLVAHACNFKHKMSSPHEVYFVIRSRQRLKGTLHTAFEASFVPFMSSSKTLLCSVYRLATLGALWVLWGLERHLD
jgi:hypothetical protein